MAIKSLSKRMQEMEPGSILDIIEPYESNTVRNYASLLSRLMGRKYRVQKTPSKIIVTRVQ